MISTFRPYGRMGNFLFQAANCVAYALRHGIDYHIPNKSVNPQVWPVYLQHLHKSKPYTDFSVFVRERGHSFIPQYSPETLFDGYTSGDKDNAQIVFDGYFQSFKYFEDYLDEIRTLFFPDSHSYKRELTCSVHIRRGDYLIHHTKHPTVTKEYLNAAIEYILNNTCVQTFVFYSDDPVWAKQYADEFFDDTFIPYCVSDNTSEMEDFKEMMSCEYNIISNSTMSLMAAILNPNEDKVCISPDASNWFGPDNAHLDTKDIIPDYFHTIKY